jgi:phosphatidylinositol alpha-mannosyltransferase
VCFLGRDDHRKGLDVLLDAWPTIADAVPHARLTVMGALRESHRDDVVYMGTVSEEDKARVLGMSEVYCAPNLGGESFGIVLAEAMASGCAVVASAIPAFAHVGGEAIEMVAPGDPVGLAWRVIEVLLDDDRRTALQAAAASRARAFDGVSVATQFVDAYAEAIDTH